MSPFVAISRVFRPRTPVADAETLAAYQYFIAVRTNAYLPWVTTILVVTQVFFMFTDYYVRHDTNRIYARVLPVVVGGVVFWLWLRKTPPERLRTIRTFWDISIFLDAYWLSYLSYKTPAYVSTMVSVPFVVFCVALVSCYSTRYLLVLYGTSLTLFVVVVVARYGVQPELLELNGTIYSMLLCLVLNRWREQLYLSEFRLKRQLEATVQTLITTQTQLVQKEKMAAMGELTAGIAHEIQNPLNFVNNFSEVSAELVSEIRDEEMKADRDAQLIGELLDDLSNNLQKINHHGGRASAIVKGMLEHSRSGTGEKRPTDLNLLVDEYLKIAYQGLRRSGDPAKDKEYDADLVTNFDPAMGKLEVMPQEIGRVLLNLYNNAFYAVREKQNKTLTGYNPTVTVSTTRLNGSIEIRVSDNGTGIPESVKAKIFQPFFTTKPTGEGTGLGLSLSYDIVTKGHGGSLTVESQESQGTDFVITLPIAV